MEAELKLRQSSFRARVLTHYIQLFCISSNTFLANEICCLILKNFIYVLSPHLGLCCCCYCCSVAKSCHTVCYPMDGSPPGSSVHGDSPGRNTGVGCHVLLQGIFPTQGSNSDLPHCMWILYCLSHQGSPMDISLSKLQEIVEDRKPRALQSMGSQRVGLSLLIYSV